MPNPWFRMYSEFADDPKVQMMSEEDQRRLVMLFCERCKDVKHNETFRAFHWRITPLQLSATKSVFLENGFIDEDWNLLNWNRRQYLSDSSTERVRQFRERKKLRQSSAGKGFIYFAGWRERVKIGYSDNPWSRISGLNAEYPGITLLAVKEGNVADEKTTQMKWGAFWIEYEWFRLDGELSKYVKLLAKDMEEETEGNVSLCDVTAPEADTEADTEADVSNATHSHPDEKSGKNDPHEVIYQAYPRKEAHGAAIVAINKAVAKLVKGKDAGGHGPMSKRNAQVLLYKAVTAYARSPVGQQADKTKIPHPSTWFNQERWGDDQELWNQVQTIGGKVNGKLENTLEATVSAVQKLRSTPNGSGGYSTEIIGDSLFPGSTGERAILTTHVGSIIDGKP